MSRAGTLHEKLANNQKNVVVFIPGRTNCAYRKLLSTIKPSSMRILFCKHTFVFIVFAYSYFDESYHMLRLPTNGIGRITS